MTSGRSSVYARRVLSHIRLLFAIETRFSCRQSPKPSRAQRRYCVILPTLSTRPKSETRILPAAHDSASPNGLIWVDWSSAESLAAKPFGGKRQGSADVGRPAAPTLPKAQRGRARAARVLRISPSSDTNEDCPQSL